MNNQRESIFNKIPLFLSKTYKIVSVSFLLRRILLIRILLGGTVMAPVSKLKIQKCSKLSSFQNILNIKICNRSADSLICMDLKEKPCRMALFIFPMIFSRKIKCTHPLSSEALSQASREKTLRQILLMTLMFPNSQKSNNY